MWGGIGGNWPMDLHRCGDRLGDTRDASRGELQLELEGVVTGSVQELVRIRIGN
jgi:hypothetical protein